MDVKILKHILLVVALITIIVGYYAIRKSIPVYVAIICVVVCAILSLVYYKLKKVRWNESIPNSLVSEVKFFLSKIYVHEKDFLPIHLGKKSPPSLEDYL